MRKKPSANKSRIFLLVVNIRIWRFPQRARQMMKKIKQENVSAVLVL